MERKTYLSIAAFATLVLSGCTSDQYHQDQSVEKIRSTPLGPTVSTLSVSKDGQASNSIPPGHLIQPFEFTGRAWFDTDRAELREAGKKQLDGLTSELMRAKSRGLITESNKLVIIGHTDSRASRSYNQKLSERRAKAVADYLKSKGIPTTSMLAVGKGELQPVASNRTSAGMQQNRRVEFHIDGEAIRVVLN